MDDQLLPPPVREAYAWLVFAADHPELGATEEAAEDFWAATALLLARIPEG